MVLNFFRSRLISLFLVLCLSACCTQPFTLATVATQSSVSPNSPIGFNFEDGSLQGFQTSEGQSKKATISITSSMSHTGSKALQVETEFLGSGNDGYTAKQEALRHTEVVVYFDQRAPSGLLQGDAPYNWVGKTIVAWVYLPANLLSSPPNYIRIFVKDGKFANDFSDAVDITSKNVGKWIQLSVTIGSYDNQDSSFSPHKVNAIGVRLETANGSMYQDNNVVYYIDDITIN